MAETKEADLQVTTTYEEALQEGFWGVKTDPVPNSEYTVEGSITRSKEIQKEQATEAKKREREMREAPHAQPPPIKKRD